jgi:hypothetical protein
VSVNPSIPATCAVAADLRGRGAFDRMIGATTPASGTKIVPGYSAHGGRRGGGESGERADHDRRCSPRRRHAANLSRAVHHRWSARWRIWHAGESPWCCDFWRRRKNVAAESPYARMFAILPGATGRVRAFSDRWHAGRSARRGQGSDQQQDRSGEIRTSPFPPAILLPNRQPGGNLLAAMLEFDPRMTTGFSTMSAANCG